MVALSSRKACILQPAAGQGVRVNAHASTEHTYLDGMNNGRPIISMNTLNVEQTTKYGSSQRAVYRNAVTAVPAARRAGRR